MAANVSEHLADVVVYWLPSGDSKANLLLAGQRRPQCDRGRPDWVDIVRRWKERQLVCIWLCEEHALEHGFVW
jgi:hypothetical protein